MDPESNELIEQEKLIKDLQPISLSPPENEASPPPSQNDEAEKVEESLRDFIGKIIACYEQFSIGDTLLKKYEAKISNAETLLEVFDIMKEMFDDLMTGVAKGSG